MNLSATCVDTCNNLPVLLRQQNPVLHLITGALNGYYILPELMNAEMCHSRPHRFVK